MNHEEFLQAQWLIAKEAEKDAVEKRRQIEDEIISLMGINPADESIHKFGGFKVQSRLTRKVDADLVQEIAQENGITEFLHTLFRWKPEIELKAWKAVDQDIQAKLSPAITVSAGRPSFTYKGE